MTVQNFALVCTPGETFKNALRMADTGLPDVKKALFQHACYCNALEVIGYTLFKLQPENQYPDSVFVEDPILVLQDMLVVLRLRRKERQGEEQRLERALNPFFDKDKIVRINPPGFVEGGDVLTVDSHLYIGLSGRTNEAGAEQLARIAKLQLGWEATFVKVPSSLLHLKGGVSYHTASRNTPDFILVSKELAPRFKNAGKKLVIVPTHEKFGANGISRDGVILTHAARPQTNKTLREIGLDTLELDMSEFEKADGALSCLSKLYSLES